MADNLPNWLAALPISGGEELHFIMRRPLTPSDFNPKIKRLNVTASDARSNLQPLLRPHERTGSTNIMIYPKNQFSSPARLSIYDSSGQTMITGENYYRLVTSGEFKVGDEIRLWSFRGAGDELCFAFEKVADAAN